MLLRLYDDDSELVDTAKDRLKKKQDEAETPSDEIVPETPADGELLVANKDDVGTTGLGPTEDAAIEAEDNAASRIEDEAAKTVEIAAGVRDEEDVFNTTV